MAVQGDLDPGARHDEPWVLEKPRRDLTSRFRNALHRLLGLWLPSKRSHREEHTWD